MNKVNIYEIEGMEFPAGRRTRVVLGDNGALKGDLFCQGYVVIYPNGSVPEHKHENVESYTILSGEGIMTVAGETKTVKKGDCIFMQPWQPHSLSNTGKEDLHMMFVYSPKTVVDHWGEEMSGQK